MNGWFPRINERGDIASGNTEIWITNADGSQRLVIPSGGGAVWLTPDSFIYNNRLGQQAIWPSGEKTPGYNSVVSDERGKWAGVIGGNPGQTDLYTNGTFERSIIAAGIPRMRPGTFAYVTPQQSEARQLVVNGNVVYNGPIVDFLLTETDTIPLIATGTYTRTYVGIPTINPSEGAPIYSDGWVCSNAGDRGGLYVRPLRSTSGYFLKGDWYYHDFRKLGDVLLIAASTSAGDLKVSRLNINDPRIDLTTIGPPIVIDPPPPPPPPKKDPVPTAPNVLPQIQAVFAAHPEIDKITDGVRGQITTLVVQALGGVPWGRKEKIKASGLLSDDALCYRLLDGRFEIYDIINGGNGAPGFDYAGTFANGENGYFYVVPSAPASGGGDSGGGTSTPDAITVAIKALITSALKPLSDNISSLTSKIASLESRLAAVENRPQGGGLASLNGQRIALKAANGQFLCAEGGGGQQVVANRDNQGEWETFTIQS